LGTKTYSDGDDVENYLLSLFKQSISKKEIEDILNDNPSWPVKYHLSDERHNLLSWFNFEKNSSILEIGAECGALTGLFLEKRLDVTAIELSSRRAEIIKERFKKQKNLKVLDGNINEKEFQNKFDYVTLIGVLEYAGIYGEGENPFLDLLKKAKGYLKKKGILIIAIENRFGLKYWRGASEDHTDKLFDSLEGYPMYNGIRTFGKEEIKFLSKKTGFTEDTVSFYYPIPDYKFCYEIFSDKYLPSSNHEVSSNLFPSPHPSTNFNLFNEKLVSQGLQENSIFDFFANSFLIFLRNE
jgi:SAM-dependent methyltransferase